MQPRLSSAPAQAQGFAMKFTHASGSQPLDGFTIKRGIGVGGFGEVYLAVSDEGKEVALKLIRNHAEVERRGVQSCLNVDHPNLLYLHGIRRDAQGNDWVVMQYIRGESLEKVLRRNPNGMPESEVLDWVRGIATGLAHLHESNIVHRDLKPGNIFRDQGFVKIGDYGLSKFVASSQVGGQTVNIGSVHYMAPEIGRGCYKHPIDVYALGVILYEMLTGRVPFDGESQGEIIHKHVESLPDLDGIREPFRDILAKALAKDPKDRFCNGRELLEALPLTIDGEAQPGEEEADNDPNNGRRTAGQENNPDHVPVEVVTDDEEPLLRWTRLQLAALASYWNDANLHPALKVGILLAGIMVVLASAGVLFPLASLVTIAYFVYRGVRAIAVPARPAVVAGDPPAVRARPPGVPPRRRRPYHERYRERMDRAVHRNHALRRTANWRKKRPAPPPKPARQKLTELTGSMLAAVVVALTMSVVMMAIRGQWMQPEQFAWLASVSIIGSWAVMVPAKIWEGRRGEDIARRFFMLSIGLAIGAAAFGLQNYLQLTLPYEHGYAPDFLDVGLMDKYYAEDGRPQLITYFAYFGFLMFLVRWWKAADAHRQARVRLWGTAWSVFIAWILYVLWPFPQPWGCMVAAVMAVTVQLASPWQPRAVEEA